MQSGFKRSPLDGAAVIEDVQRPAQQLEGEPDVERGRYPAKLLLSPVLIVDHCLVAELQLRELVANLHQTALMLSLGGTTWGQVCGYLKL